jgi:hypothetical protein
MKWILLLLLFFPLAYANAQDPVFLRVYNAQGKKIDKGYLSYLSDSSITLTRKRTIVTETPVSQIHLIKSKRTTGHRILVTTAVVAGFAVVVVALAWTGKNGSNGGFFYPRGSGKKKESVRPLPQPRPFKRYEVNGNAQNWQQQKARLGVLLDDYSEYGLRTP